MVTLACGTCAARAGCAGRHEHACVSECRADVVCCRETRARRRGAAVAARVRLTRGGGPSAGRLRAARPVRDADTKLILIFLKAISICRPPNWES